MIQVRTKPKTALGWWPMPGDFWCRDEVLAMEPEAVALYVFLLGEQWHHGHLTNDTNRLAVLCARFGRFRELWPQVAPAFTEDAAGRIFAAWLEEERTAAEHRVELAAAAGRASGARRKALRGTPVQHPLNARSTSVQPETDTDTEKTSLASGLQGKLEPNASEPCRAPAREPAPAARAPRVKKGGKNYKDVQIVQGHSPAEDFILRWKEVYLEAVGQPYAVTGAEIGAIKKLVNDVGLPAVKVAAKTLLFTSDPWFADKRTLFFLAKDFNRVNQLVAAEKTRLVSPATRAIREAERQAASGELEQDPGLRWLLNPPPAEGLATTAGGS